MSRATEIAAVISAKMNQGSRYQDYIKRKGAPTMAVNLKFLCKRENITYKTLAKNVGVSNVGYSWWLDHAPNFWTAMAFADYFGVTVEALMTDTELPLRPEVYIAGR